MNDYLLGLYEKATPLDISWKARFWAVKKAGFDFLEISIDESNERQQRLEWSSQQRREVLLLSQEIGLPIRTICLSAVAEACAMSVFLLLRASTRGFTL